MRFNSLLLARFRLHFCFAVPANPWGARLLGARWRGQFSPGTRTGRAEVSGASWLWMQALTPCWGYTALANEVFIFSKSYWGLMWCLSTAHCLAFYTVPEHLRPRDNGVNKHRPNVGRKPEASKTCTAVRHPGATLHTIMQYCHTAITCPAPMNHAQYIRIHAPLRLIRRLA